MRRIVAVLLFAAAIEAQPRRSLLLPKDIPISGVVVDPEGNPVTKASIDHTNDRSRAYQTDSDGKFHLDTNAPAIVIRKAGFRSAFVRTEDAPQMRITLQKLDHDAFPTCERAGSYYGLGRSGELQFLKVPGVKASDPEQGVDAVIRHYYVTTKRGKASITHGSYASVPTILPDDETVWRSVKYEESTYEASSSVIVAARGQFSNGTLWRELDTDYEAASYTGVDAATAMILDRFFDGACLKPLKSK